MHILTIGRAQRGLFYTYQTWFYTVLYLTGKDPDGKQIFSKRFDNIIYIFKFNQKY